MSAILCGKRSSIFEEIPSPSKRIRCSSSSSPVRFSGSSSTFLLIDQLIAIFPHMDKKLIEQALENNGHDLDLAIKSLNDLRLGAESILDDANTSLNANPQLTNLPQGGPAQVEEAGEATNDPLVSRNGAEWVELFVSEMTAANTMNDARVRAARALEALEKSIYACAKAETSQNFEQENSMLKEQVQALLQENGILKRAVSIQHERQKEFEAKSEEVQQLKQLLSQCQEHIRTLEVNNYALAMHLKQAQQNNNIPGRFNPDIF